MTSFTPLERGKLEVAFLKTAALVTKSDKADRFTDKFIKSLARQLNGDWRAAADVAIKDATATTARAKTPTKKLAERVERQVARAMAAFEKDSRRVIKAQFEVFYKEMVTRFIREYGLKVEKASRVGSATVSFSAIDEDAIAVLEQLTVQTAGRYFPAQVQAKVSEVVSDVIFREGLSLDEAAAVLKAELEGALGVGGVAAVTRFAGSSEAYFRLLASNAGVLANSMGRVIAMNDAGVEAFRLQAILDKQTTEICRSLHGKEFAVGKAFDTARRVLDAGSVEELESLMPFEKSDRVPAWASNGEGFPPFHHLCRTIAVPIVVR